jgi:hypothetical protein
MRRYIALAAILAPTLVAGGCASQGSDAPQAAPPTVVSKPFYPTNRAREDVEVRFFGQKPGDNITEAITQDTGNIEITPPLSSDVAVSSAAAAKAEALARGLSPNVPTTCKFGRLVGRDLGRYGVNLGASTPVWVCVQVDVRSTEADPLGRTSQGDGLFANVTALVKDANTSVLFYFAQGSV